MSKVLNVFYGADCLPYKDKDRVVHYPIIGSAFQGASQTTEIRFYIDRIGGTDATWAAVAKLPNGKVGTKILESSYDYELDENYVTLQLSSFYTQAKGDLYVSLQGYEGGVQVEYDSETEIYDVVGTPVIQATGSVKIAINYATQFVGSDENEQITVQEALALVSGKADTEYVKYGRLVHDLTISNIPLVDPTGIDTENYEPSQSEQLNEWFDNGIPMGIYDEEENYSFVLVCSPRLFNETLESPYNLVAMYRSARYDGQGKGKYLLVFLSPNKKFYAYLFSDSDVIYADDYATKALVDYLINKYGEQGNILQITSFPTTLNTNQQYLISRKDCVIVDENNIVYHRTMDSGIGIQFYAVLPASGNDGKIGSAFYIIKYTFADHRVVRTVQNVISYSYQSANNLFGVTLDIDDEFKLYLKNKNGVTLATVDLPLESVVVSGEYDSVNKQIVLTLEDGSTVDIPIGDLVEGLVDEQGLEEALQPYVKEIEISSVLTTNDLLEQVGTNKDFVLDNMGEPLLCYISEDSGTYTISFVGKDKSFHATFSGNTLVINLLNNTTLDIDYLPTIELSTPMQTLSSSQMQTANQDNSVIKYSGRLYHKCNIGESTIEFVSVDYDIVDEGANQKLTKYEITVNKTTGATNMITSYVSFYSSGEIDTKLEEYAKVDGNYPTMTVGNADALTPYGENSGASDTTPFVFQSTGGSSDVGVKAYLKSLRGNSVAFNQLIKNGNFVDTSNWHGLRGTLSVSGNKATVTNSDSSNTSYGLRQFLSNTIPSGHKILIKFEMTTTTTTYAINIGGQTGSITISKNGKYVDVFVTLTANMTYLDLMIASNSLTTSDTTTFENVQLVDLTLLGKDYSTILAFNRDYPKPYYPSNAGTLLSCKSNGYKTVGYNQWDEETENGAYNTNTGAPIVESREIRTKNDIKVIAGQNYTLEYVGNVASVSVWACLLDENKEIISGTLWGNAFSRANNFRRIAETDFVPTSFVIPDNARYLRFYTTTQYGTTYNHDISFHLTWDGSKTGYEPYESETYPLPNIELRSAGSVYDELKPDGTLIRKIGVVDLGTQSWNSASYGWYITLDDIKPVSSLYKKGNIICSKYPVETSNDVNIGGVYGIAIDQNKHIQVRDSALSGMTGQQVAVALSGVYLFYELATPTTEQTEYTFAETTPIDDYGTQEFLYDSDIDIPIPQGNEFFYPVDYKAFIDSLGGRDDIEYAADQVVSQTQLANYLKTISGYDATKTQTLKNVNGTFTWVDDE